VTLQNTITQLISAIRRVAREVPGAAEQIAAVCPGHDYSKAGKPKIDWDDPAAKQELVSALGHDLRLWQAAARASGASAARTAAPSRATNAHQKQPNSARSWGGFEPVTQGW